jgi:hypothetical protein
MFAAGPVAISLIVDGQPAGRAILDNVEGRFTQPFALPTRTVGKPLIEIQIAVNHTFPENAGGRPLSLAFGVIEIR